LEISGRAIDIASGRSDHVVARKPAMAKAQKRTEPKASRPQMPGYGLPENTKGLLPWKWAEQRLRKSHNYWITTVKPDGSPRTMVVWGLWQDGAFLFCTGGQSRKARNIAEDPRCVVCTELAQEAVVVEGVAEIVGVPVRRDFLKKYEPKTTLTCREWRKTFSP
jgi:hypothetical protein